MFQIYEKVHPAGGDAGDSRAFVEYTPVADYHDLRGRAHLVERDDLRGELGADTAGVAHRECNYGPSARRGIHVVISGT